MTIEAEKKVEEAQQTVEKERARLSGAVGKLVLASIGAVALGEETLERLLNRMVERGEQVQEAARKRADALRAKGRHALGLRMQKVETALDAGDLPSKADIRVLQDQVAAFSAKVDQLSEKQAKQSAQAQPNSGKQKIQPAERRLSFGCTGLPEYAKGLEPGIGEIMAIGMDDADFDEDEDEVGQPPQPVPGNVRIVIEGSPTQPYALEILAGLLLGGATEGGDQLGRRLKRWQATIASRGNQVYSESPDESQGELLRYAVIGLLSQAPDLAQGAFSTAVDATASAYTFFSNWLSPVAHSRPTQPILRRYDRLAAHGATVVDRWIDAGRAAEQRSRALVRQATFDGEDEVIEQVIGKLAQEPALRELISQQSVGMAGELMGAIRNGTAQADTRWERRVRALFHRH